MSFDVFGFGNALVDIVIQVDDSHIMELDLTKSSFCLAGEERVKNVLERFEGLDKKTVPAGSAANTVFALSSIGAKAVLCGKIGTDPHGDLYEEIVLRDRIESRLKRSTDKRTGTVIDLVTPDTERTFIVNLGASVTLRKEELSDVEEDVRNSKIFHTEGYVLEDPVLKESALHLMGIARKSGVRVSLDLSDPGIIERNLEEMKDLVKKYVDISFLNEDEARAFTGLDATEAIEKISEMCDIVIVKLGRKGSLVKSRGSNPIMVNAVSARAVDTTGAGDFYAAGFLYGLCRKKDLKTCGSIGAAIAAKVVEQTGARPPKNLVRIPELKGLL